MCAAVRCTVVVVSHRVGTAVQLRRRAGAQARRLGGLDDGSPGWSRAAGIVLTACVMFEVVNAALVATGIFLYTDKRSWSELAG